MEVLRARPFESLWHLHAQPPLWNAFGAVLAAVFGDAHLAALQASQILMGGGLTVCVVVVTAHLTSSNRWAALAGGLVALHPALVLYEAFALYTVAVAFLLGLATVFLLQAKVDESGGYFLAFAGALSALILLRSLYHPALPLAAVAVAAWTLPRIRVRHVLLATLLLTLPLGWYTKNAVQYGFWGGSSWYGMGMWRMVTWDQSAARLNELFRSGEFDPVVTRAPFSPPSVYRELGYDRLSNVPALARDDLHNVNIPAISQAYRESAAAALWAEPGHYLANVGKAFLRFTSPSTAYLQLQPNRAEIEPWARAYEMVLLGSVSTRLVAGPAGADAGGSVYTILLPILVLFNLLLVTRSIRAGERSLRDAVRARLVPLFVTGIVLYTAVIGSTMEFGENTRFKFPIEPLLVVLLVEGAARAIWRIRAAPED